ncbi:MAG: hypothetical protein E7J10_06740, partial [Streptococcus parasanguinis]|nr:hypothetical protein [Streptococcus parasanguinis]
YADFISFYSPTQLCGGGTTKSNSNELPISVPLSLILYKSCLSAFRPRFREEEKNHWIDFKPSGNHG